jgi:hypothetical protein
MSSTATWQVVIDMPRDKAWEILRDLSKAHNYVPGIIDTRITTEQKTGVGASRKVYMSKTNAMDETVTEWNEGTGFRIRLHKGPKDSPFPQSYFLYRLEDAEPGKTLLTTEMGYVMPGGFVGRLLDRLLINAIVRGRIRDVALSMKLFYETGEPTRPAALRQLRAQLG